MKLSPVAKRESFFDSFFGIYGGLPLSFIDISNEEEYTDAIYFFDEYISKILTDKKKELIKNTQFSLRFFYQKEKKINTNIKKIQIQDKNKLGKTNLGNFILGKYIIFK